MEQNHSKFRLKLSIFDVVVLVLVIAVAAILLWKVLKPAKPVVDEPAASTSTMVHYTMKYVRWENGHTDMIRVGSNVYDNVKNSFIGTITSVEVVPYKVLLLDHESREYVLATTDQIQEVIVEVECPGSYNADSVVLEEGYTILVGATAYVRGEGYMTTATIMGISREGQK